MIKSRGWLSLGLAFLYCVASTASLAQTSVKKPVSSQDDLPRYSYPMTLPASQFVMADDATFKPFADAVYANVQKTLNEYDIKDRSTLRGELSTKFLLEELAGQNEAALATLKSWRENEDKADLRVTDGLTQEAIIKARIETGASSGKEYEDAVGRIAANLVDGLDWAVVADSIKQQDQGLEVLTPAFIIANLKHDIDPAVAQAKSVDQMGAQAILLGRRYIQIVQPVQSKLLAAVKTYIAAHNVVKPDIWAAREVTLSPKQKLTPVLVGIWDSGVDTSLFGSQLYTDPHPGAHSPHGLAFDMEGEVSKSDLEPTTAEQKKLYPQILSVFQGFDDLANQVDSPDAARVRDLTKTIPAEQLPAYVKQINFFGNYLHGTHVAGIAARGNPAVRLVVARFNDNLVQHPTSPSVAWATKYAADFAMLGDYFRTHHVRVVNMSWGDTVAEFETWLGKTSPEKDPAKRKAEATAIYNVWRDGIAQAIKNAPDTLFVVAAGNSDSDAGFDQDVPVSLHLPNIIAVGAVNQAGDETNFTSYGDTVVVDAAGYRVPSVVPGGRTLRLSGTSMASPNVVNLAAKLFALDPSLSPQQAIDLIKRGADKSEDGRLHLINPKASVELLSTMHSGHSAGAGAGAGASRS